MVAKIGNVFDAKIEKQKLVEWIRNTVFKTLKKRGAVVGVSGGIDSAVVAALAVEALGKNRLLTLALPEKESSPESLELAHELVTGLGVPLIVEDITAGLEGMGAYRRRDEAVKAVFPAYRVNHDRFKIVLQSNPLSNNWLNLFKLTLIQGKEEQSLRLPLNEYLQIVAASNMKQRLRMVTLYYHAERKNYAVVGTGNKNEHCLGFFVKYGDGGTDLKPIAHLYKTEVYELAKILPIPTSIQQRQPTTDTYPAEVSQEEFFFRLPFSMMDAIWRANENGESVHSIANQLHLDEIQVKRIIDDLKQKQRSTEYLRLPPLGHTDGNGKSARRSERIN